MPYVVVRRVAGGPNPDLVPGMRLGDSVNRTLVPDFVQWFDSDALHLAPPEPEAIAPVVDHGKDKEDPPKTAKPTTSSRAKGEPESPPAPATPARKSKKKTKKTRKRKG